MDHIEGAFDISICDPTYEQWESEEGERAKAEFHEFVKSCADDLFPDTAKEIEEGNVGYGADVPTVVLVLLLARELFKAGKEINDNLDGWKALGRKTIDFYGRISQRSTSLRLSRNAAIAVGLAKWAERFDGDFVISSVDVIEHQGPTMLVETPTDSERFPESIYIIKILATGKAVTEALFLVYVKANGHVFVGNPVTTVWMEFDTDVPNLTD